MQDFPPSDEGSCSEVAEFEEPQIESTPVNSNKEIKLYTPEALKRLTGDIPDYSHTDVTMLHSNRYRIDVWSKKKKPDHLIALFQIEKSFHAALEDGEFIDKTIQPKIKPGQKMNIFSG